MIDKLAYVPLLAAAVFVFSKGSRDTFLYLFLPVAVVLPVYYQSKIVQGIPEFSFWSAALFPIFLAWLFLERSEGYRFDALDGLILAGVLLVFLAQWANSSYKEAQKVLFNDLMARFVPYVMVRTFALDPAFRRQAARVIVLLGAFVGIFLVYESRMFYNLFDEPLRKIWPSIVSWGFPMVRSGLKRAYGPFGHPICAGYFLAMVAPLALWLWKEKAFAAGLWGPVRFRTHWGPKSAVAVLLVVVCLVPLGRIAIASLLAAAAAVGILAFAVVRGDRSKKWGGWIFLACAAGLAASLSRAPIIGAVLGFGLILFGWAENKAVVGAVLALALVAASVVILPKFVAYVSVDRASAETEAQRNAAYRKEMLDNYKTILAERPWLGWGRFTVPVVKGQKSIDNEYLFLALTSGKVSAGAYILMIAVVLFRLARSAVRARDAATRRMAWSLLAGWIAAILTQTTVFAGTQTVQFFYILAGLAAGLDGSPFTAEEPGAISEPIRRGHAYHFSRPL